MTQPLTTPDEVAHTDALTGWKQNVVLERDACRRIERVHPLGRVFLAMDGSGAVIGASLSVDDDYHDAQTEPDRYWSAANGGWIASYDLTESIRRFLGALPHESGS